MRNIRKERRVEQNIVAFLCGMLFVIVGMIVLNINVNRKAAKIANTPPPTLALTLVNDAPKAEKRDSIKTPISVFVDSDSLNNISIMYMFQLNGGIFNVPVDILIGENTKSALKFVQSNVDSSYTIDDFKNRDGVFFVVEGIVPVIWLREMPNTPETIGVANHELMHLVSYTLNRSGVTLSDQTSEVYAYQLGNYSEQLYNHIK